MTENCTLCDTAGLPQPTDVYARASFVASSVDPYDDLVRLVIAFLVLGTADKVLDALHWFGSKSSGRYFTLHILVNAFVTVVHLKDVYAAYSDPANAAFGPCDTRGSIAIYALHLYHIAFWRPLPWIDWVHHTLMALVVIPLAYCFAPGHLLGHGAFYASGLPGGLDYVMLVMVKRAAMAPQTEKAVNARIQLWMRAPGCLAHSFLSWLSFVEAQKRLALGLPYPRPIALPLRLLPLAVGVVFVSFLWNGMFFLERVIVSNVNHNGHSHHHGRPHSKSLPAAYVSPITTMCESTTASTLADTATTVIEDDKIKLE